MGQYPHVGGGWVDQIAHGHVCVSKTLHERMHVFSTVGSVHGLEQDKLVIGALNSGLSDTCTEEAGNEVSQRRHSVHEDPEVGHVLLGGQNTTEDKTESKEQVTNGGSVLLVLEGGSHHVSKSGVVDVEGPEQEEEEGSSFAKMASSVILQANGVVKAEEDKNCHQSLPGSSTRMLEPMKACHE